MTMNLEADQRQGLIKAEAALERLLNLSVRTNFIQQ